MQTVSKPRAKARTKPDPTPEQKEIIIEQFHRNQPFDKIAQIAKCDRYAVKRVLYDADLIAEAAQVRKNSVPEGCFNVDERDWLTGWKLLPKRYAPLKPKIKSYKKKKAAA